MLYDVSISITYAYDQPANAGRHLLRLAPANLRPETQRVILSRLELDPAPDERIDRTDFFGNRAVEASYRAAHGDIAFRLSARVLRNAVLPGLDISPGLTQLQAEIAEFRSLAPDSPHHFLGASPRVRPDPAMTRFALDLARPDMTVFAIAQAVSGALHARMEFDPEATTVDTSAADAFANSRGVCQDFTHIMIACLRGIGIPAGYVSGLLRTIPPKGEARLEGADAMHAWAMVWCGREMGWVELDPTNAMVAGTDHIVVARGRDYGDVAPVKGVLRTSGAQTSKQAVDVVPLGEG